MKPLGPDQRIKSLADAVELEGYTLQVRESLDGPDGLGTLLDPTMTARACLNRVIAVRPGGDEWCNAYSVSHEISEVEYNFQHSVDMFCYQANLLARWHRRRIL